MEESNGKKRKMSDKVLETIDSLSIPAFITRRQILKFFEKQTNGDLKETELMIKGLNKIIMDEKVQEGRIVPVTQKFDENLEQTDEDPLCDTSRCHSNPIVINEDNRYVKNRGSGYSLEATTVFWKYILSNPNPESSPSIQNKDSSIVLAKCGNITRRQVVAFRNRHKNELQDVTNAWENYKRNPAAENEYSNIFSEFNRLPCFIPPKNVYLSTKFEAFLNGNGKIELRKPSVMPDGTIYFHYITPFKNKSDQKLEPISTGFISGVSTNKKESLTSIMNTYNKAAAAAAVRFVDGNLVPENEEDLDQESDLEEESELESSDSQIPHICKSLIYLSHNDVELDIEGGQLLFCTTNPKISSFLKRSLRITSSAAHTVNRLLDQMRFEFEEESFDMVAPFLLEIMLQSEEIRNKWKMFAKLNLTAVIERILTFDNKTDFLTPSILKDIMELYYCNHVEEQDLFLCSLDQLTRQNKLTKHVYKNKMIYYLKK